MCNTLKYYKEKVHKRVHEKIVEDCYSFMKKSQIKLIARKKNSRMFDKKLLYLAIYKDCYNIGYKTLHKEQKIVQIGERSLREDIKRIREVLSKWGETKIDCGELPAWRRSFKNVKVPKALGDIHLIVDSSDFTISGKLKTDTGSKDWSYKNNGPAQRYMVFVDGNNIIRKIFGGYSPKIYDSDLLKIVKNEIERDFKDSVILGDNHFKKANEYLDTIEILTNFSQNENISKKINKLTKEQTTHNNNVSKVRKCIESVFGLIKRKFECFECFFEGKDEQDKVFKFACGVHNVTMDL